MRFKYYLGALLSIPLLPVLYFQSKRLRKNFPRLPEANGTSGSCPSNLAKEPIHLLTIGESTIAGVGVGTHEEGFTGSLAKALSKELNQTLHWKVHAKSGYTAARIRKKIIPKIEDQPVDLIVIGLGANDAFALNSPSTWIKSIRELIQDLEAKFPKAKIVFCNMPPIKEFPAFTNLMKFTIGNLVELLGQELAKLVRDMPKVYYCEEVITIEGWTRKNNIKVEENTFFSDGVHPSKLTYQVWGKEVAGEIFKRKVID